MTTRPAPFKADEPDTPAGMDVPDSVRSGGTAPGHQDPDTPDQSAHDADKGEAARPDDQPSDSTVDPRAQEEERVEREQSIDAEDRADGS